MFGRNHAANTPGHTRPESEHQMTTLPVVSIQNLTGQQPTCGCDGRDLACAQLVCEFGGRWFIRMHHAGFNLSANNRQGYATEAAARKAVARIVDRIGAGR